MNRKAFHALLSSALSVKVWPDFIPERKSIPAVAYDHSSDNRSRILNGKSSGVFDNWRITIIGNSRQECDDIKDQILLLEQSALTAGDFQSIMVLSVTDDPVNALDKTYRISIDVRTYER